VTIGCLYHYQCDIVGSDAWCGSRIHDFSICNTVFW